MRVLGRARARARACRVARSESLAAKFPHAGPDAIDLLQVSRPPISAVIFSYIYYYYYYYYYYYLYYIIFLLLLVLLHVGRLANYMRLSV